MRLPDRLGRVNGHENCDYTPLQVDGARLGFIDHEHHRYQMGGSSLGAFLYNGQFSMGPDEWNAIVSNGCETIDFVERENPNGAPRVFRINVGLATPRGWEQDTPNGPRRFTPRDLVVQVF